LQVRHATLLAFFRLGGRLPEEIEQQTARSGDRYLRQTAALLIAERGSYDQLARMCSSSDAAGRLAGVLAVGFRLTVPPATQPLADDLPLAPLPAEEPYVIQFADKKIDLRKHGRIGSFTVAEHWRAKEHLSDQERLFALLVERLNDSEEVVRLQAAHFLRLLNDARTEPAVANVIEESEERRLAVAPLKGIGRVWLVGPFADMGRGLATIHPPEVGPIDLATVYKQGNESVAWREVDNATHLDLARRFGARDDSSFYAYFRLETVRRERARLLVGSDDGVKVWQNGREVWANPSERAALPLQDDISLVLEPGSNDVLVRVQNVSGECGLYLHYRALGNVALRLPEKLGADSLAERLKGATGTSSGEIAAEFLKVDWPKAVGEANIAEGRRLFEKLGCVKCHAVNPDAVGTGGPSLADASKRFTLEYLVESVLLPSKQMSPLFRRTSIATDDGKILTGLVVSETVDRLELLEQDGTRRSLAQSDIAERSLQDISPMPAGIVKTPSELSALLAYLLRGDQ
jgi:putative heme-binding domain-containing protein